MIHTGDFIFLVFGEAVLFDVFVGQFTLGGALRVFGRQVGGDEDFFDWVSCFWVGLQRWIRHALDDFEAIAFAAVGEDLLI